MSDNVMALLIRSFDEELRPADRARLEDLLAASEDLRREQERVRRMRRLVSGSAAESFRPRFADRVMARLPEHPPAETTRLRRDRPAAVRSTASSPKPSTPTRRAPRKWRLAVGLSAAGLVAAAIVLVVWLQPRTIDVPYGASKTVEFADGSVAELGSGSSLTYRTFAGRQERTVRLEGEAFFDVAEEDRPFVVETFNASVTVLGTRFNVRAWSSDSTPETAVALESGRVAVTPRTTDDDDRDPSTTRRSSDEAGEQAALMYSASEPVVLEPGQGTVVPGDSAAVRPPESIRMDHVVAWRSGGLAFVDQPVGAVLPTIERRYAVEVRVAEPDIRDRLVTYLNPHPSSAEAVISDICHTLDLRYRHTANGYEILPSDAP